ncbi:type ISP restriction/modification enzyme [Ktedonobacter racemifer]|uniref:type ISP restriction/modification enzyme n=1 Tax=Ktedonobacter racemifer TaxID=363277 RepID=UPI0002F648E0|nr:type ISP restriction/modification enzyme [Ktedonobacter racemifer]
MGSKEARAVRLTVPIDAQPKVLFKTYSLGVRTNRDDWLYGFNKEELEQRVLRFIDVYNGEVDRWARRGNSSTSVDDFVLYDDTKIKWSEGLKLNLQRHQYAKFSKEKMRTALYRPFVKKWLFSDRLLNERVYQFPQLLPTPSCEIENRVIVVSDIGFRSPFSTLATNLIPELHLLASTDGFQCFPYYTYLEDGSNRRENITDWALKQFQEKYGAEVTKWDIFHYIYGMLHHPQYRELYKENLKRDLPHIPLLLNEDGFEACVSVGRQLMDLHVNYEQAGEYQLKAVSNTDIPMLQRLYVKKMKLSADKTALVMSEA